MAYYFVSNGVWNLFLIKYRSLVLLIAFFRQSLAVGIHHVRTPPLVRDISKMHVLPNLGKDTALDTRIWAISIQSVLIGSMLGLCVTETLLAEIMWMLCFIYITQEAREIANPYIVSSPVEEVKFFIVFASGDIEGKALASCVIIEADKVDSNLKLVFDRRNRKWVYWICKFILAKTRHIDNILMRSP